MNDTKGMIFLISGFVLFSVFLSCEVDESQGPPDKGSSMAGGYGQGLSQEESGVSGAGDQAISSTTPMWSFESNSVTANLGDGLAVCNFNGDAYLDIAAGAPSYDGGQDNEGKVYVFYGSATGFASTPDWSVESNSPSAAFGSVACGDFNNDGRDDLLIGARGFNNGQANEGIAYLYYGSHTGLGPFPSWSWEPNLADTSFGQSVAACDVNADGYDDVIAGGGNFSNGQTNEGRVWLFYGSAGVPNSSPDWTYESNQSGAYLGFAAGCAGDVNGDSYQDLIVGVPDWSSNPGPVDHDGEVLVFHGSSGGPGGSPNWSYVAGQESAFLGQQVSPAGDVNNDGYDDIMVSAPYYDNPEIDEGRVYIFHGSAGGLSGSPNTTMESGVVNGYLGDALGIAGDINDDGYGDVLIVGMTPIVTDANTPAVFLYLGGPSGLGASPTAVWQITPAGGGASYKMSVAPIPDLNGDGHPEIVIGQGGYTNGENSEGRVFVVSPYPLNDTCAQVRDLGALPATVTDSTINASDDFTPTCGGSGGKDLVFKFHGGLGLSYVADLTGSFNTVLSVQYNSCDGTLIGCNDDYGAFTHSHVEFVAPATGDYYVWVDGWASSEAGSFTLSVYQAGSSTTTTTTTTSTTTTTPPTTTTTTILPTTTSTTTTTPPTTTTTTVFPTTTSTTTTTGGGDDDTSDDDTAIDDDSADDTVMDDTSDDTTDDTGGDDTSHDDTSDDDASEDDAADDSTDDDMASRDGNDAGGGGCGC